MQWFYLDETSRQIPAEESELAELARQGVITGETLLWNESLPDWHQADALHPGWFAAPARGPALVMGKPPTIGIVKRPIQTSGRVAQGAAGARTGALRPGSRAAAGEDGDTRELVRELGGYLAAHAGWMKFTGVMAIIYGVLNCLSIVGAVIGWLPIWMGVVLLKSASSAELAAHLGQRADLEMALERAGFYFKITGVTVLVTMLLTVALVVFALMTGLLAAFAAAAAVGGLEAPPE